MQRAFAWYWIVRAVAVAVALWLFIQWQSIGAYGPAVIMWLLCACGAEMIIEMSERTRERRRHPSPPLRGGRRRSDPPIAGSRIPRKH
jgi:hypothetical protein